MSGIHKSQSAALNGPKSAEKWLALRVHTYAYTMTRISALLLSLLLAACASQTADGVGEPSADSELGNTPAGDPAKYPGYLRIVREAGGDVTTGHVVVLGLRGRSMDGTLHDTHTGKVYDDTFVILRNGTALELQGSTHPWFTHSVSSPDVDGDHLPDVAMIRPGRYHAAPRPASSNIGGLPSFHVVTVAGNGSLPTWRDTKHDGSYDAAERAASEKRHDLASSILVHLGGLPDVPAIGCQVLPHDELQTVLSAVASQKNGFDYVLVDAHDVSELP